MVTYLKWLVVRAVPLCLAGLGGACAAMGLEVVSAVFMTGAVIGINHLGRWVEAAHTLAVLDGPPRRPS